MTDQPSPEVRAQVEQAMEEYEQRYAEEKADAILVCNIGRWRKADRTALESLLTDLYTERDAARAQDAHARAELEARVRELERLWQDARTKHLSLAEQCLVLSDTVCDRTDERDDAIARVRELEQQVAALTTERDRLRAARQEPTT